MEHKLAFVAQYKAITQNLQPTKVWKLNIAFPMCPMPSLPHQEKKAGNKRVGKKAKLVTIFQKDIRRKKLFL